MSAKKLLVSAKKSLVRKKKLLVSEKKLPRSFRNHLSDSDITPQI